MEMKWKSMREKSDEGFMINYYYFHKNIIGRKQENRSKMTRGKFVYKIEEILNEIKIFAQTSQWLTNICQISILLFGFQHEHQNQINYFHINRSKFYVPMIFDCASFCLHRFIALDFVANFTLTQKWTRLCLIG